MDMVKKIAVLMAAIIAIPVLHARDFGECHRMGKNAFSGKIKNVFFTDLNDGLRPVAMLKITFEAIEEFRIPFASVSLNFSGSGRDRSVESPTPFAIFYNNPNIYLSPVQYGGIPTYLNFVQWDSGDVSISPDFADNDFCQFINSNVFYDPDNPLILYLALYYQRSETMPPYVDISGELYWRIIGSHVASVECVNEAISETVYEHGASYICCINC